MSGVDPEPRLHQHIKIPDIQPDLTQFLLHQLTFSGCDAATRGQVPAGYLRIYRPRLKTLVSHLTGFYRFSKRKIVGLFFEVLGPPNSLGLVCKHQARTTLANVAGMAEMDCRIMYSAEPKNVGRKRTEGLREAAVCMGGQFHFGGEDRNRSNPETNRKKDVQLLEKRAGRDPIPNSNRSKQPCQDPIPNPQSIGTGAHFEKRKPAPLSRILLSHLTSLWRYARVECVEPTNNKAKRQLRDLVIYRKISLGIQSAIGRRFVDSILLAIATCKLQKYKPFDYLGACIDSFRLKVNALVLIPGYGDLTNS